MNYTVVWSGADKHTSLTDDYEYRSQLLTPEPLHQYGTVGFPGKHALAQQSPLLRAANNGPIDRKLATLQQRITHDTKACRTLDCPHDAVFGRTCCTSCFNKQQKVWKHLRDVRRQAAESAGFTPV